MDSVVSIEMREGPGRISGAVWPLDRVKAAWIHIADPDTRAACRARAHRHDGLALLFKHLLIKFADPIPRKRDRPSTRSRRHIDLPSSASDDF